ncbi:DUF3108 domain-containing protein [Noviherbaspirillum sp. Root189]|uniref:DUF3108 domain-containing protein n=1 Tax=Noviherbaspirillum sp. Root189 TaxID=1736487 RepID=UPI00070DE132|nr:DUF3108 domain-containing protein [Noviherbaspirillum sp. Root189]KRB92232.1 hypothetical protein ASE07_15690 [Noviherbaspirillum sp. Root189]
MIDFPHSGRPSKKHRAPRIVVVLVVTAFLHLLVFQWAEGRLGLPSLQGEQQAPVITIALNEAPPVPVATPAPPPKKTIPKKPRPARPKPPKPPAASPPPPPEAAPAPNPDALAQLAPAGMEAPGTSVETPVVVATPDTADSAEPTPLSPAESTASATTEAPQYPVALPPSAQLDYDVIALRGQQKWYGSGTFVWESAGGRYSITGEANASLLLINLTVLQFRSEGLISEQGVAPLLYSEKPRNKSQTNTHFQQEKRKITFSASEAVYPYQGGEQDRASVMWQLAGIGRGDPGRFVPGAAFDIVVAGARDAETWRIGVIGEEEIETPFGKMKAWHVRRAPRQKAYDQIIDIWLAPQQQWYPVRLRQTSTNGDYLEMSLSNLNAGIPPATQTN